MNRSLNELEYKRMKTRLFFVGVLALLLGFCPEAVAGVNEQTEGKPVKDPNAVTIEGVTWASCNVAAPGVFAATPAETGALYQWGVNYVLSASGDLSGSWNSSVTGADGNDQWNNGDGPCPEGWRLPVQSEIQSLLDKADKIEWTSNYNNTNPNVRGYIFTKGKKKLFLRGVGRRSEADGTLSGERNYGYYWSGTAINASTVYSLFFGKPDDGGSKMVSTANRARAYSVRCVKKSD
jgi:uncharacterized protein (TIGR02145 family)